MLMALLEWFDIQHRLIASILYRMFHVKKLLNRAQFLIIFIIVISSWKHIFNVQKIFSV